MKKRFFEMFRENQGQMTVELAVVFPVVMAVALVSFNALNFMVVSAKFDRASRNAIRACATSPAHGQTTADIVALVESETRASMGDEVEVSASAESVSGGHVEYSVTMSYSPTLFGAALRGDFFGVSLPRIDHSENLVVDSYRPGILL